MTAEPLRFVDSGKPLGAYAHQALVVCPNCDGPAIVQSQIHWVVPFHTAQARVHCLRCSFVRERPSHVWYGPVVGHAKQRCPNCGYKWLEVTRHHDQGDKQLPSSATMRCPACQQETTITLQWFRERFTAEPVDPTFGLQLWLQTSCCGHRLWAYNQEHLGVLGAYVAARHRIRPPNNKWSMFTRLPRWMKIAKNRDAILKCCDRLEQRWQEAV